MAHIHRARLISAEHERENIAKDKNEALQLAGIMDRCCAYSEHQFMEQHNRWAYKYIDLCIYIPNVSEHAIFYI